MCESEMLLQNILLRKQQVDIFLNERKPQPIFTNSKYKIEVTLILSTKAI